MDSDEIIAPIPGSTASQPVVIATHNGSFHADDLFGVAVLQLVFPSNRLIRTRDAEKIAMANFAVDVGGVWEPALGRFDHHQKGFAGARPDGTIYASAGLVWAAYGRYCLAPWENYLNEQDILAIVAEVDAELVIHMDRSDTGEAAGAPGLFGWSALLSQFNPTWLEGSCMTVAESDTEKFIQFEKAVFACKQLLMRVLAHKASEMAARNLVRNSQRLNDGRVLLLGGPGMPWFKVVCAEMPDVLFVVYPDSTDNQYQLRTVPVEPDSFVARADLPAAWAGLRDGELAVASGVADAAFCHNGLFIGGAYSLGGALRMAELALEEVEKSNITEKTKA